ncbi:ATP-binding protein [Proteiniclasticum sp.]|uniref:AAA family ATPase n=1 Tax=Proteiniclasticum sp. TaxID=2053595 RepID=UPI002897A636|nr:ATP-binding protein [Proteiniclasticum sp.]
MLIQFRFSNFKSFRDDTILDFTATKITEHNHHVLDSGGERLLPIAAIYGANASGKSNVIEAFSFMVNYVLESFNYGGESEDKQQKSKMTRVTPFLFDLNSKNEVTTFEVFYVDNSESVGRTYNYGFTLNQKGIVEEWFNTKAKTAKEYKSVVYRNNDTGVLELSGIPKKSQENIRIALEREALIVSLGTKLKISKMKNVRDWFMKTSFANFGDPLMKTVLSSKIPNDFAENEEERNKVVKFFSAFDPSIIGFNVEPISSDDEEGTRYKIDAVHKILNSDETISIPLDDESSGTLKMFALYPILQETLMEGGILLIDELNSRLHPLLVRNFLLIFLNPDININNAQLVFTTHDSWQLSNNLLRRDEIWFTEKSVYGVSSLYSLADFVDEDGTKIRKDESYEKNYLLGKYGAVPSLRSFDMFLEE